MIESLKEKIEKAIAFLMKNATSARITVSPEEFEKTDAYEYLKMYILIREDTPADIVPLIASHLPMLTYRKFKKRPMMQKWFETKLQKTVICKVSAETLEKAKEYGEYFSLTEVHHQELGELGLG
ncbi:MAG: hypothetical protein WCT48_03645, partial [Candidatus Paceibacterota bacterium]